MTDRLSSLWVIDRLNNLQHTGILYLGLLLVAITIAGSHWLVNPYRLSTWIYSSDTGHIIIESRCASNNNLTLRHKQIVTAGYYEYRLPLPKCKLSSISLTGDTSRKVSQEISLTNVTYYGQKILRLNGVDRTLAGEGIYARDTRPKRSGTLLTKDPILLSAESLDTTITHYWWPRWLPLILVPVILWVIGLIKKGNRYSAHGECSGFQYSIPAAVVLSLITTMAMTSRTDVSVHPDELTHVASAHYYFKNWLKPKIGSEETIEAHQSNRFGVAYLTGTDPVYLLAGKFAVFAWPVFQNDVIALRMFNVSLFATISLLLIGINSLRLLLIPFLLTPQSWYVFSYFNGDGLALFLSVLAVATFMHLKVPEHSSFKLDFNALIAVFFGAIIALLVLSKPNYWPVLGVLVLLSMIKSGYLNGKEFALLSISWIATLVSILFYLNASNDNSSNLGLSFIASGVLLLSWVILVFLRRAILDKERLRYFFALAFVVLLGFVAIIGLKFIDETYRNPPPLSAARADAITKVIEANASERFKPSALLAQQSAITFKMREKGVGLEGMLVKEKWFLWSFNSFFGVYGYMNIGPSQYILYVHGLAFLFAVFWVLLIVNDKHGKSKRIPIQLAVFMGIVTVVCASIGYSWLYDFEPQGRYLLGILPILGAGLASANHGNLSARVQFIAILPAFLLSTASYLFIGLQGVPKLPALF